MNGLNWKQIFCLVVFVVVASVAFAWTVNEFEWTDTQLIKKQEPIKKQDCYWLITQQTDKTWKAEKVCE